MNKLQLFFLFLAIPAVWFGWYFIIYLSSSGVAIVSDLVIFIIGAAMAITFVVVTVKEFQSMSRPNK